MLKDRKMSDEKITKEQAAVFAGIDNIDIYSSEYVMIHELLNMVVLIANGEYEPEELKEDIFNSDFG